MLNNNIEQENVLEQAKVAAQNNLPINNHERELHKLAEAHYEPAIEVFEEWLIHPNWFWREMALILLGFHYDLSTKPKIIYKIKEILKNDESIDVQMAAALVLSSQTDWPDPTLMNMLDNSTNFDLLTAVFNALLGQKRLPPIKTIPEMNEIYAGRKKPDLANLQRIISENIEGNRNS